MKHFIYPIAVAFLVFEFGCGGGGNTTPPPPPPADFSVSVTNTPINLPVDGNVQVNVAVKSINGFSGAVTITSPGNSGDVNYGSPITVAAGSSGNITMSAVQAALLGDRNFVLKATSGSIEHDLS
ncbi:MAG TPA: hypothetical protein VJP02_24040, partial [Candidatus Sulfotelmatobacter sp.]|nr:hypothetical protein [Candidatus Sulfotelmatobacter sp.]